jgi:cytochrome c peroxidase
MDRVTTKILSLMMLLLLSIGSAQAASDIEKLGELLYFDENLSINRNQACSTCHTPASFSDPVNALDPVSSVVSLGSDVQLNGGRNAPTASYAAFSPFFRWDPEESLFFGGQFWDGRAATLAEQAKGPFLNPVEMAMPSKKSVLVRIAEQDNLNFAQYSALFPSVFNVQIEELQNTENPVVIEALYNKVADAIAAFEKSGFFSPFTSKFDYFLAGQATLSKSEQLGMMLFNGKAKCNACHTSDPLTATDGSMMPPLFTDFSYDNIGLPKSSNPMIIRNPVDFGLGGRADIAAIDRKGLQLGKFKVSTLRNIAVTAPYGHNGVFSSLEEIVHFYNTRDVDPSWPAPEVTANVNKDELGNLHLTAKEEIEIVAFLRTLTDGYGPAIYKFPFPPAP